MVQRTRRQVQNILAEPSNLQELIIPQNYTQFEDGVVFLLNDSGTGIDLLIYKKNDSYPYLVRNVTLTFSVTVVVFSPMEHSAPPQVIF